MNVWSPARQPTLSQRQALRGNAGQATRPVPDRRQGNGMAHHATHDTTKASGTHDLPTQSMYLLTDRRTHP